MATRATPATFLGMPPFPVAARAALADTQLRRNLAHATGTIRDKRAAVIAELDDWEGLRQQAARIKDDTLAHLDEVTGGLRRRFGPKFGRAADPIDGNASDKTLRFRRGTSRAARRFSRRRPGSFRCRAATARLEREHDGRDL